MNTPSDATTRLSVRDGIATLTLNRPHRRNAMTRAMLQAVCDDFDAVNADDDVRAVVVTGAGSSFCVGADLADAGSFGRGQALPAENRRDAGGVLALRIFACRKPVIAAINGDAVGVGATMTLPMDVRLASEATRFAFPFARRGIVPESCASWFLPRVVGISRALEWTMFGGLIPVTDAREAGLVRSVHAATSLLDEAHQLALRLTSQGSPTSISATRRLLWQGLTLQHPMHSHEQESALLTALAGGPDAAEGVASFLEKRPPEFRSRSSVELAAFEGWWAGPEYAPIPLARGD